MPVIPATQETEIRRIEVLSKSRQIVIKALSRKKKTFHSKGWWSSSRCRPSAAKKKKKQKKPQNF
jgi:hypothetical protein